MIIFENAFSNEHQPWWLAMLGGHDGNRGKSRQCSIVTIYALVVTGSGTAEDAIHPPNSSSASQSMWSRQGAAGSSA
jgi:hypothetical protein